MPAVSRAPCLGCGGESPPRLPARCRRYRRNTAGGESWRHARALSRNPNNSNRSRTFCRRPCIGVRRVRRSNSDRMRRRPSCEWWAKSRLLDASAGAGPGELNSWQLCSTGLKAAGSPIPGAIAFYIQLPLEGDDVRKNSAGKGSRALIELLDSRVMDSPSLHRQGAVLIRGRDLHCYRSSRQSAAACPATTGRRGSRDSFAGSAAALFLPSLPPLEA